MWKWSVGPLIHVLPPNNEDFLSALKLFVAIRIYL